MAEGVEVPTFRYYTSPPEPLFKEGVTRGFLVMWTGEPGPARCLQLAALADGDGIVSVEQDGEWKDVTVTAD